MDYAGYIGLAFIFASAIAVFRSQNFDVQNSEKSLIAMTVGWILVIYGLIVSFSIGFFYNRYVTIREMFVTDVTNLQLTYRMLKELKASPDVLLSIKRYVRSVLKDQLPALQNGDYSRRTEALYYEMDTKIINYLREYRDNAGLFTANILMRLSTDTKVIQLVNEINSTEYYISILWFLLLFVMAPLYLVSPPNKLLQFGIDFCLLSILVTAIYLCTILNNPFYDSPISIKMVGFQTLYKEICNDFPGDIGCD